MNIYAAASLFATMILLYWVISEVFTVLFRLIGLPEEKARFQVVSMLTGCGFTTHESEFILSTRSRRRLARITMLFGFVFNVTIVSAFINVFVSAKVSELRNTVFSMAIPLVAVAVVLIASRTRRIRKRIDRRIEQLAGKLKGESAFNSILMIDQIGDDSICQVTLKQVPEAFADRPLAQTGLKQDWDILVLLVERKDQKASAALARTVFKQGDRLTVFGDYIKICKAFHAKEHFNDY